MTDVARTSPTSFATGSGPVRPAPSSACPCRSSCSRRSRRRATATDQDGAAVSCQTSDRYLHPLDQMRPTDTCTTPLADRQGRTELVACFHKTYIAVHQFSSSGTRIRVTSRLCMNQHAHWPSCLLLYPVQKYSSQGERKRMVTKKTPTDEEIDGTYLQSI